MANDTVYYDLTEPARLFHPNLFEARAFGQRGRNAAPQNSSNNKPKFSVALGLKPGGADLKALLDIVRSVAGRAWPGRDVREIKAPIVKGDTIADNYKRKIETAKARGQEPPKECEYFRGLWIMRARSIFMPKMAGVVNGKPMDFDIEGNQQHAQLAKKVLYFGAMVGATVGLRAYDGVGANPDGVNAYLQMVFGTGAGERIGGDTGPGAAEKFAGWVGRYTSENPLPSGQSHGDPWNEGNALDDEIAF